MTIDKVEILSDKISFLEKKIDRIEELLLFLVEEEYLTEEEKLRIVQADELIKNRKFDKLVKVN